MGYSLKGPELIRCLNDVRWYFKKELEYPDVCWAHPNLVIEDAIDELERLAKKP